MRMFGCDKNEKKREIRRNKYRALLEEFDFTRGCFFYCLPYIVTVLYVSLSIVSIVAGCNIIKGPNEQEKQRIKYRHSLMEKVSEIADTDKNGK